MLKAFRKSKALTGGLNYADSITFGMPGNAARVAGTSTLWPEVEPEPGPSKFFPYYLSGCRISSPSASLSPTLKPAD